MPIESLFEDPWLEVKKITEPDHDIDGYVYSHEGRCGGRIVALLPFRAMSDVRWSVAIMEFLLRSEVIPCWSLYPKTSSITGGVDMDDPHRTAVTELAEEGGYQIDTGDLIDLGTCHGTKSTDTVYHLFSANLTGREAGHATGDGSMLETRGHCFWSDDIGASVDPLTYVMWWRLMGRLRGRY